MTSVYLSNLSSTTTKESLDKFMVSIDASVPVLTLITAFNADVIPPTWQQAFCGSIQSIEMHEGNKAIVTFEKPSAASTALMLNGTFA